MFSNFSYKLLFPQLSPLSSKNRNSTSTDIAIVCSFFNQLTTLLACCCRRKRFINSLVKQARDDCVLLAVRGCDAAQDALCLMLEWHLLPKEETRLQVVNALESTTSGKSCYAALCQRQKNLQELVSKYFVESVDCLHSRFGKRHENKMKGNNFVRIYL